MMAIIRDFTGGTWYPSRILRLGVASAELCVHIYQRSFPLL